MGTKNATSTTTQQLPDWVTNAYKGLVDNATSTVKNTPYTPYTGGFEQDQKTAFKNIGDLAGSSSGYFNGANSAYQGAQTPTYQSVGNYMNPYVQNVVNSTMKNMQEMNGQQQQQVIGNAISKGAMGGNRVGVAQAELARQQDLANNQTISGLWNDAYTNALGAAQNQQQVGLSAGRGLSELGQGSMNANLAQGAAQLGAGTQQQQFNYQQFLNKQGYPYQQQSWLSGILGNTNAGSTTTSSQPYGNGWSQLLGAGLGIASLFAKGGAVQPYGKKSATEAFDQGSSNWGGYVNDKGMPYQADNGIYLPYIPVDDYQAPERRWLDPLDPTKNMGQETDPFSGLSTTQMKKGLSNIGSVFKPHLASGGGPSEFDKVDRGGADPYSAIHNIQSVGLFPDPVYTPNSTVAKSNGPDPRSVYDAFPNNPDIPVSSGYNSGTGWAGGHLIGANNPGSAVTYGLGAAGNAGGSHSMAKPSYGAPGLDTTNALDFTNMGLTHSSSSPGLAAINGATHFGTWQPSWAELGADAKTFGGSGLDFSGPNNVIGDVNPDAWTTSDGFDLRSGVHPPRPGYGPRPGTADKHTGMFGMDGHPLRGLGQWVLGGMGGMFSGLGAMGASRPSRGAPLQSPAGANAARVANGQRPITYSAQPVAAGNFAADSPNASFEKDHGMGSVTNSMASSSRWNTGYADGGKVGPNMESLTDLMAALKHAQMHWKGRAQSNNIEDRRDPIGALIQDAQPTMPTDHFGPGTPTLPTDHFTGQTSGVGGFASGGTAKRKDGTPDLQSIYGDIIKGGPSGGLVGDALIPPAPLAAPSVAPSPAVSAYITPDDAGGNQPPVTGTESYPYFNGLNYDAGAYGNTNDGSVPYSTGGQFQTNTPGYSQNIGDAFNSLKGGKGLNLDPDFRQSMLTAGLGMMASKSPFAMQGIGEGGLKGIEQWNTRQGIEKDNAQARAGIAQRGQEIGTQAAGTQANMGQGFGATAAGRYTFSPNFYGMMVTDTLNPGQPKLVPWYGQLPNGQINTPPPGSGLGAKPGATKQLFNTDPPKTFDPRLMSPGTSGQVGAEVEQAVKTAYDNSAGAHTVQQQIAEMRHNLDGIPDNGLLVPGTGFEARTNIAKTINTTAQALGMPPIISPDEVASTEEVKKVASRMAGALANSFGSNAASIIEGSIDAVPSGANTKAGAAAIMDALDAMNRRQIDYYDFVSKYAQVNGSVVGAQAAFDTQNPPELYALSAFVPKEAMDALIANPKLAGAFNQKYGNGRNVAQYVLGQ